MFADELYELPGDLLGTVSFFLGQQHGELVAPKSGDHVAFAQPVTQSMSDQPLAPVTAWAVRITW